MSDRKRIGYWLSEKKSKKLSLPEIEDALRARNIEPVKIDLEKPLSNQGPFHGILHKLTDFIAQAELGNVEAQGFLENFQQYSAQNPNMIVIDPIDCLRTVINRFKTYSIISNCLFKIEDTAFVPAFAALQSHDVKENATQLKLSGVKYPAVCKPIVAHGTSAHQVRSVFNPRVMTLVFNEKGLREAIYPCVVQSFVNHNAVLYKLFVLGERYYLVERPSIRNFHDCEDLAAIHFDGGEISKANSSCQLNFQDGLSSSQEPGEKPCQKNLSLIVKEIRNAMGLGLFGIDVAIEATTGRLAVVDVNAFPGYDGVEDFSERLAEFVRDELDKNTSGFTQTNSIRNGPQVLPHGEIDEKVEPHGGLISSRLINKTSIA